ncbi:MAG: hypothetical protein HYR60_12255 [Acidobacteria bacterium]|nr:hypothetical protein [Acidobacteriota bacterium]
MTSLARLALAALSLAAPVLAAEYDYKLVATKKTSTAEKELNEAARAGYQFQYVMGGVTAIGGSEVVCVLMKESSKAAKPQYEYRLLATNRTSTMEKEMQAAGREGYRYRGQTVFESAFGGKEVVVIMERDAESKTQYSYRLQATSKTSTMQKELLPLGREGFRIVGLSVATTAFGGAELVAVVEKEQ